MRRLFVAVPISDRTRFALLAGLADLDIPGRRVAPGDWHVTLRFIGSASEDGVDRLVHHLDEADLGGAFDLLWTTLGAFPHSNRATVLWVGASEGARDLELLAGAVEEAAVDAGFGGEERPFQPHLTLSRIRPPQEVGAVISAGTAVEARMRCDAIHLMESHLERSPGSRYETIETFSLD